MEVKKRIKLSLFACQAIYPSINKSPCFLEFDDKDISCLLPDLGL